MEAHKTYQAVKFENDQPRRKTPPEVDPKPEKPTQPDPHIPERQPKPEPPTEPDPHIPEITPEPHEPPTTPQTPDPEVPKPGPR